MLKNLTAEKGGLFYKIVFVALSALIALSFAIWGMADMIITSNRTVVVAQVGDVEIKGDEFLRLYTQQTQSVQELLGVALDSAKARELGFVDSVMSDLIRRALFDNEAQRMELSVSDTMTRDKILYLEDFQDEAGLFSELIYRQLLREAGYSERSFVRDLKRDLERRQLMSSIASGPKAPQLMMTPLIEFRHEKRFARSILLKNEDMPKARPPSATVLQQWFDERVEQFATPQLYEVSYITLEPSDLSDEIDIDEQDVKDLYEQRLYFFSKDERRRLLQILVDEEELAQKIREQLDSNADFASVAQTQAQLTEQDITLGWNTKGELLSQLADDIFALDEGAVSEVLQSPFGFHIFKVEEVEEADTLSYEEVREDLLAELKGGEALEAIYQLLANVEDQLAAGESLEDTASSVNLEMRGVDAIDVTGKDAKGRDIENLPQMNRFLKAIKDYERDEESLVNETESGGFFVLRIDEVTPPRERTFEEAQSDVLAAWMNDQQAAIAEKRGKDMQKAIARGDRFEQVVADFAIVPFEEFTRSNFLDQQVPGEIAQELFDARVGEVVTATLKEGYMIAILDRVEKADLEDDQLMQESQERVILSIAQDLLQQYRRHLETIYSVTISDRAIDSLLL